jgi:molybdate transport system ATP-binding protein
LPWLRAAVGLGSVFEARIARRDPQRGLLELAFDGGVLLASDRAIASGTLVRLRIAARDVTLASDEPHGLSLHNALSATVSAVTADHPDDHVVVQLVVGRVLLLAEVTRDAIARLGISVGARVYALIKSVSIRIKSI